MKIVILGPSGQVGGMFVEELKSPAFELKTDVISVGRSLADVVWDGTNLSALDTILSDIGPDIIINAIAYTAVDKAESEHEVAFSINSDLPSLLADYCQQKDILLIHYSTDFVFNGQKQGAWTEFDEPEPLSVYGKSKLAGEKALQMSQCKGVILRTSWVFGETGNNFMKTMIRLAKERAVLGVVDDQRGCPTYSRDIARATLQLIKHYHSTSQWPSGMQLYHLSGSGSTTWYGFAHSIFERVKAYEALAIQELNAIPTSAYPTPALRPENSVLDCSKIHSDCGITMPLWETSLAEAISRLYV